VANRLAGATSPYLLQHAQNPVDWYEWGPEALEEARQRDVPILLSVGYAACHWCHVMAHESFEDAETAAYLNQHFVSVKVDREERPDVDAVYMSATQAMTGHGGWPMTCVLDHDGSPFFAGTYFPDQPRHGQPSFRQVLTAITDAWENRSDDVAQAAGQIRAQLQQTLTMPPGQLGEAALDAAVTMLAKEYDREWAGFGSAPKFPPSMVLSFLQLRSDDDSRRMLGATCTAMARGGLYDQLGGGFARYSVDRGWVVPHFEKMLYDNAQLLGVYARWGGALGERVARETADFLLRELRTPEGGFASALDADTEGEEGKFYVWTPAELRSVLGEDDGAWATDLFEVTGTFEHGSSTLQLPRDPNDPVRFADVRRRLLAARDLRTRPARDDKIVAAWNGLAITALCEAGTLLEEPAYVEAAARAGQLLIDLHLVNGRLRRVSRDRLLGRHLGVLEDHACVASGFLSLVQATGDAVWLEHARDLLDAALNYFRADDGGFHDTANHAEALIARPREFSDNASPGGQSAMAHALVTYAALTGEGSYRTAAEETVAALAGLAERAPRFAGWTLAAAQTMLGGPAEIAVVGRPGPQRDTLERAARRRAGAVVVVGEPGRSDLPLLTGREEVDGAPAAYVCRNLVCERPVTAASDLSV
jgi:uncharacterized protein YyaL (SSP411 family)